MTDEVQLHECKHCSGTGTCATDNGKSCDKCIVEAKPKGIFRARLKNTTNCGIVCSVCDGLGEAQTKTNKLNSRARFTLSLAIIIPVILILVIVILHQESLAPQYLTFSGTLIASITGYYFGSREGQ